jgi:hypothetical protein
MQLEHVIYFVCNIRDYSIKRIEVLDDDGILIYTEFEVFSLSGNFFIAAFGSLESAMEFIKRTKIKSTEDDDDCIDLDEPDLPSTLELGGIS